MKCSRLPYWLMFVTLIILQAGFDTAYGHASDVAVTLWIFTMSGIFILTSARLGDIGWSRWWTIAAVVPLFNVIIGFYKSKEVLVDRFDLDSDHIDIV